SPSEQELEQLRAGSQADAISAWNATREQRETPAAYQWRIAGAAQAEDVLERAAQHAAKFEVDPELRSVEGSAAECLLQIAKDEDFDLICVGSIGMSGTSRFMLGNVPHRLSHQTPTDILILNTRG
ncbi:MAG: universal stress protein, partial [Actinomycetota bacterium]